MNKFYKVYDGLFPDSLTNLIEGIILDNQDLDGLELHPKWNFHKKLSNEEATDMGMGYTFVNDEGVNSIKNSFYFLNPLYYFLSKFDYQMLEVTMGRMWLQLPSNSEGSVVHYDRYTKEGEIPDPRGAILLYYVNDSDGDTVLYEDDKKTEIVRVTPKKGRCIFFSNLIPHKAGNPKQNPRAVINYNFYFLNPSLLKP